MLILNWVLTHLNAYLTAVGWGMTPDVQAAFAGLIALGAYDLLRQKLVKPTNVAALPPK